MGIWLYPQQEGFMSCSISVDLEEDLVVLVEKLASLYRRDVLQNHPVIGNVIRNLAASGPRNLVFRGTGAIPDHVLDDIKTQRGWGFWNARFALYGTESMMKARWSEVEKAFANVNGCKLENKVFLSSEPEGLRAEEVPITESGGTQIGVPNLLRLQSIQFRGINGGHITFSPVLPPDGDAVLKFYLRGKEICAKHGFDFHAGFHLYPHHLNHLNLLYFDNDNEKEKAAVHDCFLQLLNAARDNGYSEYRIHLNFMDAVAAQYDFNNHIHLKFTQMLKDAIDPKGILAPGKSGIWPRAYLNKHQDLDNFSIDSCKL